MFNIWQGNAKIRLDPAAPLPHFIAMNHGVFPPPGDGVFLVNYEDCKCLAVRGAGGRWKGFYDDVELPGGTEAVMAIPIELVLPFLPAIKRARLCPARLSGQT
jgi:hypothetical protein